MPVRTLRYRNELENFGFRYDSHLLGGIGAAVKDLRSALDLAGDDGCQFRVGLGRRLPNPDRQRKQPSRHH